MARLPAAVSAGVLLVSACVRSVPAPAPPPETAAQVKARVKARIQDLEDRRSLGNGELQQFATSAPEVIGGDTIFLRSRALLALARIQDVETLDTILPALESPGAPTRDAAAFALGQLALSWESLPEATLAKLTEVLVANDATQTDEMVRARVIESLGKLATPGAVEALTARLSPSGKPWTVYEAAMALGVAARKAGPAAVASIPLEPIRALLTDTERPEWSLAGAYFLSAAKRPDSVALLRSCLAHAQPDVRALCAKGLGDVGGPGDAAALSPLLEDETPRVSAEAARTLAKLAAKCAANAPCEPLLALDGIELHAKQVAEGKAARGHALLAVAQQGLPLQGRTVLSQLRSALAQASAAALSDDAREDVAWLDCRFAAAMDRQVGGLEKVLHCGYGRVPEPRRLALGLHEVARFKGSPGGTPPSVPGAAFAVRLLNHASPVVRGAALDALAEHPVPEAKAPVRALIAGDDAVVAGLAAATAGKLRDAEALPSVEALAARVPREPDLAEAVAGALVALKGRAAEPRLREWLKHPHANVRRVAAESLTSLTGKPVRSSRVELPPDTYRPPSGAEVVFLTLRTRKGDIVIRVGVESPLTVGNLAALARKGYFRGVTFHRVVPDFVAQGGDPRGDGEGGPGHSIRCEMTHEKFVRGTVGMALSGKDTGGSQFFITHSPQPHLDGRYTAFGRVEKGMDVVDALLEGTVIDDVLVGTRAP
ncbi:peptidyl-prolyl cis-trans isomerase [Corallococcus coralloides]|uniref:peptidylprolyl isomerase n=1 Tax=Corallococcus coralloides TaxID=184914 RepID=A0A410RWD5_CORCK|nr:peptidylprolyl isomerase [Corallococcus coralloides]QAT86193.1 peptidyl-prolyl cis-trans isomerase [Corallococcus coralloides]